MITPGKNTLKLSNAAVCALIRSAAEQMLGKDARIGKIEPPTYGSGDFEVSFSSDAIDARSTLAESLNACWREIHSLLHATADDERGPVLIKEPRRESLQNLLDHINGTLTAVGED